MSGGFVKCCLREYGRLEPEGQRLMLLGITLILCGSLLLARALW